MRSRNDQEKAERREALLNAAQTVFFKQGFENTSMDDIATQAGFSRALLYVYFKDKKDIYRALRIRAVNSLQSRMIQYVEKHQKGIDKTRSIGQAYYDFYREDKDYFHCLTLNISLNNQSRQLERSEEGAETEKNIMKLMVSTLELGISDNTLDAKKIGDPLESALFIRGSLHGVILMYDHDNHEMQNKTGINKDQHIVKAIERLTNSLRKD